MGSTRSKTTVAVDQLAAFYAELQKQATRGQTIVETARNASVEELDVANYPTGLYGIESLAKFTASVVQACDELLLKEALGAESSMPAKTKRGKSKR